MCVGAIEQIFVHWRGVDVTFILYCVGGTWLGGPHWGKRCSDRTAYRDHLLQSVEQTARSFSLEQDG